MKLVWNMVRKKRNNKYKTGSQRSNITKARKEPCKTSRQS